MVKEGVFTVMGRDLFRVNKRENMNQEFERLKIDKRQFSKTEGESQIGNNAALDGDESTIYLKALYHALQMEYITIVQLQSKMGGEVNQTAARKLIEKMASDGFVEEMPSNRRMGRRVIHSDATQKKLEELQQILKPQTQGAEIKCPQDNMNPVTPAIGQSHVILL
eukprot:c53490_g1_i1 orf=855-1352(+)